MVDKKLHNTTGTSFLQSVDYRYTIQGQLSAINNAQLNADANLNDDTDDYFGMELLYNNVESGLNNDQHFNGNIAAIKWKGIGASTGAVDQKSYKYTYDKSGKLKSAAFQMHSGSAWSKEAGVHNEAMGYDHNGNIKSLQRNARKHQLDGEIASYTNETIDNLTYAYSSTYGDRLDKVEDAATGAGFSNGTSGTSTDFTYDLNGNLTTDKNKGIDSIHYNFLGKVRRIKFTDGRVITYRYDAGGSKLLMKTYPAGSTTPVVVTDYVNGFFYENGILKFFGSPEGRVVMNGNVPEYQYAIADHQGNTRVVFSSVTPGPDAPVASFEGNSGDGVSQYRNVDANYVVTSLAANHTASGNKVIKMNQTYMIGPARSLKVYPGDKIDMEAWVYYEGTSGWSSTSTGVGTLITNVAAAFGGVSGGSGESGAIYSGVSGAYGATGAAGNEGDSQPSAYLNYILFDKDYKFLNAGFTAVPDANFAKQNVSVPTVNISEAGYIFIYLSYEGQSNNWIYFDDFKVTHTKTNVIQYNEYYPFGLQASTSWTRENHRNDYLYNEGNELNQNSGWYETFFREYDPALGRFLQVDPLASVVPSYSPYAYSNNDPVLFNDPLGLLTASEFWGIVDRLWSEAPADGGAGWSEDGGYTGGYDYDAAVSYGNAYNEMHANGGGGSIVPTYGITSFAYRTATSTIGYGITGFKYVPESTNNGGLFWNEFNKSDLLKYAEEQCKCKGGKLEDYAGNLFEKTFHAFMKEIDETYRPNSDPFDANVPGRFAVVPDGVATSQVSLGGLPMEIPNGSWYEVKATTATITASSFGNQAGGLVNALAQTNPKMAQQGVLFLTFATTHDASLSIRFALSSKYKTGINVGQHKAMFRVIGGTPMITFYSAQMTPAYRIKYFSPFRTSVALGGEK